MIVHLFSTDYTPLEKYFLDILELNKNSFLLGENRSANFLEKLWSPQISSEEDDRGSTKVLL